MKYRNMAERLLMLSVLEPETGCWLWLAKIDKCGYGRINVRNGGQVRAAPAHRIAYAEFVGQIPKKHDIDHRHNCPRNCIAPDHLKPMEYKKHRAKTQFSNKNAPNS